MPRSLTVAEFLTRAIAFSGKPHKEIAREAGFERPNVISMMRTGEMKICSRHGPREADMHAQSRLTEPAAQSRDIWSCFWDRASFRVGDPR